MARFRGHYGRRTATADWIRAGEILGKVRLTARHPYLGAQHVEFEITPTTPEAA